MNPKPLASLNHFTVPSVRMVGVLKMIGVGMPTPRLPEAIDDEIADGTDFYTCLRRALLLARGGIKKGPLAFGRPPKSELVHAPCACIAPLNLTCSQRLAILQVN